MNLSFVRGRSWSGHTHRRGKPAGAIVAALATFATFTALTAPAHATVFGGWESTGQMSTSRYEAAGVKLQNGSVLMAGGARATVGSTMALTSAEIYTPSTGTWTTAASMGTARVGAAAALLHNGKVLVVGGQSTGDSNTALDTGEVYDPGSNTWTAVTNTMSSARGTAPIAVTLSSGKVLIAGGTDTTGTATATADLYDPSTNTFAPTAHPMGTARAGATGNLLPNGKVLVAGGVPGTVGAALDTAEVYDPAADSWSATSNSMSAVRGDAQAVTLLDGKVFIAGGIDDTGSSSETTTASTDFYDPSSNSFSPGPAMASGRAEFGMALMSNGTVMIAGGIEVSATSGGFVGEAQIYNPLSNSYTDAGQLVNTVIGLDLFGLNDGTALGVGGTQAFGPGSSNAQLFTPAAVPSAPQSVNAAPGNGSAVVTFSPSASDNGRAITTYTVKSSTGQTATTDGATVAVVSGLKNGTPVTFTVTATNAVGTSPASGASATITPGPPTVTVTGLKTKVNLAAFLKGVKFTVTPNKAAALQITLIASTRKAVISRSYNLTLAGKSFGSSASKHTLTLKPNKKLVGTPSKKTAARLVIVATDPNSLRSTTTKTINISPNKKPAKHKKKK